MRDMPLHVDFQKGKGRFISSSSRTSSDPGNKIEQLLEEIDERERYIKQVTEKTHSVEKEAYEKGFAQGEKAGMELGEKRFDSVIKSFNEALEEVRRLKEELYQKTEQEMLELVLAITRRIIKKEVSTDNKVILNLIKSALKYVADQERVKVRLNPSDLEFASQHKGEIMEGMKEMGNVILEGNEGVSRGDAVIESNHGIIDCGIEKHLQKVEEALKAQVGKHPQGEGKKGGEGEERGEGEELKESREDHVN
jgi:flagellar assembly protein FliH